MLARLIYASEVAAPLGPQDITQLLRQARMRNAVRGITGLLVFDSKHFLQVIEGAPDAVNRLYVRMATDPRHARPTLLSYAQVAVRRFSQWQMGFVAADAQHRELYGRLTASMRFDPMALRGDQAEELLISLAAQLPMEQNESAPA